MSLLKQNAAVFIRARGQHAERLPYRSRKVQEKAHTYYNPIFKDLKYLCWMSAEYTCALCCSGRNSFRLLDDMKNMKGYAEYLTIHKWDKYSTASAYFWVTGSCLKIQAPWRKIVLTVVQNNLAYYFLNMKWVISDSSISFFYEIKKVFKIIIIICLLLK